MPVRRNVTAADFVPHTTSISVLREAAKLCRGCALWGRATQTVFGEGAAHAEIVLVGEQPGDREDRAGMPFVGPAGMLLDRALQRAGIDRSRCYVTNIVKHFKWEPRGKRRIHKKPNALEISACKPWFDAEVKALHPKVIVCLGATAAQALLGPKFRVTLQRGELIRDGRGRNYIATAHPSSILRADDDTRDEQMQLFVRDLQQVSRAFSAVHRAA